jgi:peptidylprolyl isomerase
MPDRDGFAAQTGFSHTWPVARNPKTGKTWLTHCYAMVGAGRGDALDSGSGAELYAMLTTARGLDRNVTMVGRVVQGMATLSITPRGTGAMGFYEKPEQRQAIKRVRVASDMAASERPQLEVLRSNTAAFKEYISLRRNQRNPWFRVKAGYADVCSVPPIVRAKAPAN